MAISVLAGSLQDCSVWHKCVCIDLVPSSRKDSAHSAVVCVLRECTLIYSLLLTVTQSIFIVSQTSASFHLVLSDTKIDLGIFF